MAAADYMRLVQPQGAFFCLAQFLDYIPMGEQESARVVNGIAPKRAKGAAVDADICIINLPINYIKGAVSVFFYADMTCEGANCLQIRTGEKF